MANITSFNVRGIADTNKRRQIFYLIRDKNVDIALLQETHSCSELGKLWNKEAIGLMAQLSM